MDEALETLAVDRRVAVRLHLRGQSLAEIARITGWTSGKARNLLYRGLADLRASLELPEGAA
jgi:RNA polymerase sigma-70 factor (ECF subfamily)